MPQPPRIACVEQRPEGEGGHEGLELGDLGEQCGIEKVLEWAGNGPTGPTVMEHDGQNDGRRESGRGAFGLERAAYGRSAAPPVLCCKRMTQPVRKPATYDDVLAVPDHMVAEIINGELIVSPRPAPPHARAASVLGDVLGGPFDRGAGGPGGWWILDEPELHLQGPEQPIVPDLAGWRTERMPALPETAHFSLAPDWVCEVPSPSTAARDRADKMPIYAAAGVGHAWLVDPLLETLEIFVRDGAQWTLSVTYRGSQHVRAEPFEAVAIDLSPLWRRRVEVSK